MSSTHTTGGKPVVSVEREIGGRTLRFETGRVAKLASGAVVATYGETTVLGTAAVTLAMINVVGGYLVTDRMLGMFKKKDTAAKKTEETSS